MSAQIDSAPDLIRPVNQPLIFTVSDTVSAPERFIVEVFEDGTNIATLYLTPNDANHIHFDLAEIARSRVEVDNLIRDESSVLHSYTAKPFTTGREGMKKYEVKVGRYNGGTAYLDQDQAVVYLVGGAEQISSGLLPSFAEYYPTSGSEKTWLTDRKLTNGRININVSETDEGVVAFLHDSLIIGGTGFMIAYNIYNGSTNLQGEKLFQITTNGGQALTSTDYNQKITYSTFFPGNTAWIPTPWYPGFNPTWTHYEIELQTMFGVTVGAPIRFTKDCGPVKHTSTQIGWTNTRGGWDYLRFDGRARETTMARSKNYKKTVGNWNGSTYSFLPSAREIKPYQTTASKSYSLNSISFTQSEVELLQYAFRSENVMMKYGSDEWLPVTIDTKSYSISESISKIPSVALSVTISQTIKC